MKFDNIRPMKHNYRNKIFSLATFFSVSSYKFDIFAPYHLLIKEAKTVENKFYEVFNAEKWKWPKFKTTWNFVIGEILFSHEFLCLRFYFWLFKTFSRLKFADNDSNFVLFENEAKNRRRKNSRQLYLFSSDGRKRVTNPWWIR